MFLLLALLLPTVRAADAAISDDEAAQFGRSLAALFNAGKSDEVLRNIDLFALGNRGMHGLDLDDNERSEIVSGAARGLRESMGQQFKQWTSSRFIRVNEVAGEKRVFLRVVSAAGMFNFFDIVCARKAAGGLKAVDVFILLSGELMSATLRRSVLPAVLEQKKGMLERLVSTESEQMKAMPTLQQGTAALLKGEYATALAAFESLPREVQTPQFVLQLRLQAAQRCGEQQCLKVIEEWERNYPGDPTLDMVSIDGCFLRKDFSGASRHLESLQIRTGPDGYLEIMRALMLKLDGRPVEAVKAVKHALAVEPSLTKAYDVWFDLEHSARNWPGIVAALQAFETAFPKADLWKAISSDASWADFRESAECKAWREAKAGATAETNP